MMPSPRKKPAAIGIKAAYPGFIPPALATSINKVPSGERWIHEIKFDGYRVQVHLKDAAVKVFTRRGNDWTNRFRKIASDAWHINAGSAIIDGEVMVPAHDLSKSKMDLDEDGRNICGLRRLVVSNRSPRRAVAKPHCSGGNSCRPCVVFARG
jgi:hypothetical protein